LLQFFKTTSVFQVVGPLQPTVNDGQTSHQFNPDSLFSPSESSRLPRFTIEPLQTSKLGLSPQQRRINLKTGNLESSGFWMKHSSFRNIDRYEL